MTCIVGTVSNGQVYLAADSMAGDPDHYLSYAMQPPKVFQNGGMVFGYTTSFRFGQLLQHGFRPPAREPDTDVYAFMCTDFIDSLRTCLKSGGWASRDNEREWGGDFLVGYEGRLFQVQQDYAVIESASGYDACGSGAAVALGALFVNRDTFGMEPTISLEIALEAAAEHNMAVRGPYHHVTTSNKMVEAA